MTKDLRFMTPDEPTNILVVDDRPENLLVYRAILGELNQNLITAGSGEKRCARYSITTSR